MNLQSLPAQQLLRAQLWRTYENCWTANTVACTSYGLLYQQLQVIFKNTVCYAISAFQRQARSAHCCKSCLKAEMDGSPAAEGSGCAGRMKTEKFESFKIVLTSRRSNFLLPDLPVHLFSFSERWNRHAHSVLIIISYSTL